MRRELLLCHSNRWGHLEQNGTAHELDRRVAAVDGQMRREAGLHWGRRDGICKGRTRRLGAAAKQHFAEFGVKLVVTGAWEEWAAGGAADGKWHVHAALMIDEIL